MTRRPLAVLLVAALLPGAAACGNEDGPQEGSGGIGQGGEIERNDQVGTAPDAPAPPDLEEVEARIGESDIELERVGQGGRPEGGVSGAVGPASADSLGGVAPLNAARLQIQDTADQFDLFTFASEQDARRAERALRGSQPARSGGAVARAGTVVAVFDRPVRESKGLQQVMRTLRELPARSPQGR